MKEEDARKVLASLRWMSDELKVAPGDNKALEIMEAEVAKHQTEAAKPSLVQLCLDFKARKTEPETLLKNPSSAVDVADERTETIRLLLLEVGALKREKETIRLLLLEVMTLKREKEGLESRFKEAICSNARFVEALNISQKNLAASKAHGEEGWKSLRELKDIFDRLANDLSNSKRS